MAVPYTFGSATASIPLSQLDSNFATTITLGNTAIQLGNTVTTLNNMTLANVTISSGTSNLASTSISNGTSNVTVNSSGGNITLGTAGTTAVTIDTSQNVGIGVTPSTWTGTKAIEVGSLGTALWSSGAGSSTLANGAYYNSGWKYANATSKPSILDFDNTGKVTYYAATATSTAGSAISLTQLLAVEAGKSLALQGATTQTGTGITFPATQSASSNANTLDDYEEGTWTATDASGASLSFTNTTQTYTKIGRVVTLSIDNLAWPVNANGNATEVGGLPFTSSAAGGGGGICNYSGSTIGIVVLNSASSFRLYKLPSAYIRATNAEMTNNSLYFSITYMTT